MARELQVQNFLFPGPDQVLVEVAGDVAHHPSHDPAAAPRATAREAEAVQLETARGVEAVTTRDQGLAPLPVTAGNPDHKLFSSIVFNFKSSCSGADQSPEAETRRKQRRTQGASLGRRRTRAGTSRARGMDRPPLGISLVLGRSLVPDLRQQRRPSSLHSVDCDASSKPHHELCSAEKSN